MSLGLRLKTLRKSSGLTQQNLADKVGVSRIYIQALESNRRLPSMKLLQKLAQALGVELADIVETFGGDRQNRFQIEELWNSAGVELWYKRKRLSPEEVLLVRRLVDAALSDWDEGHEDRKDS
ncbi:MAG: helix-turn-helix transcriptional regulator [Synergistaceae bacterium]|nr:helix-turn-helix transcriptional regulator [Synergistaceae bacterium]